MLSKLVLLLGMATFKPFEGKSLELSGLLLQPANHWERNQAAHINKTLVVLYRSFMDSNYSIRQVVAY
jgi:hypothetical protein